MKHTRIPAAALLLTVCLLLGGCSRHDSAAAAEVLAALSATAALPDYAVVADTKMTVEWENTPADGLSMTQRMWRTGDDAMQKMATYDVNGEPLFENGSALIDGVYYWFDGESWSRDDTGIAAAANLTWMPLVSWPEEEKDVTVTQSDGVYTVEIGEGAFPAMIEEQLAAMEAEEQALIDRGLASDAQERRQARESAARAQYEELRYTIEVEDGLAVSCTTYSRVRQPAAGQDTAEDAAMPVSEITYTWRLTGTDAAAIADIIGEAAA